MKNSRLIFALLIILSPLFAHSNVSFNDSDQVKKTIILINGSAFLVDMNVEGKIVTNYLMIEDYFTSNDTHETLIEKASKIYDLEFGILERSKLIIFAEGSSLLDDSAVDNIRRLSTLFVKSPSQNINITFGQSENKESNILSENRVSAIRQLLKDFGVKEGDMSTDVKIYRSELPNQFVKIELVK